MKKKVKIAIIDDGINDSLFVTPYINLNIEMNDAGVVNNIDENIISSHSHGSICSAIIKKYLKHSDIDYISIKILDNETKKGNTYQLVHALNWCIDNDINVVNCSFGTTEHTDFDVVKNIIIKAVEKDIIIISAMNNKNIYSLPACLHNVIGVKNNYAYNDGLFKLRWYPFDDIELVTSGIHQLIMNNNEVFMTSGANSYATPVITAIVSDIIYENGKLSYDEILLKLQDKAKTIIGEYVANLMPYLWNVDIKQHNE